jgi:hypothetical protein
MQMVPRTDGAESALRWGRSQTFFGSFFQKRTLAELFCLCAGRDERLEKFLRIA